MTITMQSVNLHLAVDVSVERKRQNRVFLHQGFVSLAIHAMQCNLRVLIEPQGVDVLISHVGDLKGCARIFRKHTGEWGRELKGV